jgi:sigma-B regulation protein RsbU (phosphoserine phosphatase)
LSEPLLGAINFEDLFETAPCGFLLADQDGHLSHANRTFTEWTGYGLQALREKRFSDLLTVPGKIFYETHFAPTLHMQDALSEIALDLVSVGGQKIPVFVNAIRRGDGRETQLRIAVFKAAERRGYEQNLLHARNEAVASVRTAKEESELREQFIAILGHDLRNPVASIASGVHMLGKESLSERGKKVIGLMEGSVVRAAALIDNVLDFARGRLGGGITLIRNAGPLEPVLRQVVSELRSVSPGREIHEAYLIDKSVACDHVRVGQLLSNLLGNALAHGAKDQPVGVQAWTSEDTFSLTVSNAGDPIPPSKLDKLFQPFVRGNERRRQGLGLGLHIAAEIAKAHGGTLAVRSDHNATEFTFTISLCVGENSET